jgi:hypothetical protein
MITTPTMLAALTSTVILPCLSTATATAVHTLHADFNMAQFLTQLDNDEMNAALVAALDENDREVVHGNNNDDGSEAGLVFGEGVFNTNISLHDGVYVNDTVRDQQQYQHRTSSWHGQHEFDDSQRSNNNARESKSETESSTIIENESEAGIELNLPRELADLIAHQSIQAAKSLHSTQELVPQQQQDEEEEDGTLLLGYYPTHIENELCSSKSTSKFELWEEYYQTLEECCEVNFSWELDACLGRVL